MTSTSILGDFLCQRQLTVATQRTVAKEIGFGEVLQNCLVTSGACFSGNMRNFRAICDQIKAQHFMKLKQRNQHQIVLITCHNVKLSYDRETTDYTNCSGLR